VCLLVVEKSSYAELFGGRAVPAGPVPSAGCLVAKDTVQPVAVLRALGWISVPNTLHIVRIVADTNESRPSIVLVHESVGTPLLKSLPLVALVVHVTA